jgi:pimeloyl-[acyl-carrier protein] methyl ester esterase
VLVDNLEHPKPHVSVSGSGPNLTLIHGWGLHGGIWQTVLPKLEQHFTVHNIDLPGFGKSTIDESVWAENHHEYDLEFLVRCLLAVIPQSTFLCGWSLGGVIATAIASKHPNRVNKLITVASSPRFVIDEEWPHAMRHDVLESFIDYLNKDFRGTLIKFLSIQTMGSATQKQDIANLKATVFEHGVPSEIALAGGLQILKDVDLLQVIQHLPMPLLRIYGKLDTLVPLRAAKQISELVPNSESKIFMKSGHSPFLSEGDDFVTLVSRFLSKTE